METGNLYIEVIPRIKKHFLSPIEHKQAGCFYPIPSINNRTSRTRWLANDKKEDVRIVFKPEENGILSVWNFPEEEEQFVVGAIDAIDTENKYSVAAALNSRTLNQSVELAAKLPPDLFAIEIFKLSAWLNCARIGFDRSAKRHGSTLRDAFIAGNPQHNVIGYRSLLHLSMDSEYGFELNEDSKTLFFDNFLAAIREEKIKLNSEKLVHELKAATLLEESDFTNRAHAMAICFEMARLYPYRKPRLGQEFATGTNYNPLA